MRKEYSQKMVPWRKNIRKIGALEKSSLGKKISGIMVPWKKSSHEKWSPEKGPQKIVIRQRNSRKFERLFYFYRLIPVSEKNSIWIKWPFPFSSRCFLWS